MVTANENIEMWSWKMVTGQYWSNCKTRVGEATECDRNTNSSSHRRPFGQGP